jgi:asparagine synthase (glutamine-hydrolysing)
MAPAYVIDLPGGGRLLGSSLLALRWLADRHELDDRGAAGFLTLGWTMGDHTAVAGARVLPGGSWTATDGSSRRHFGPAELIAAQRHGDKNPARASEELVAPLRALGALGIPVRCAVTAGRDSRLVLALCLAAGIDPVLYTGGVRGEADVEIGIAIAELLGREHELTGPLALDRAGADEFVTGFMAQNDGVSTLESLHDHVAQMVVPPAVEVVVTGIGGEIARAGTALAVPLSAVGRPFADVAAVQRRLLEAKLKDFDGLVLPQALALAREQLDAFVDDRREEGWPVRTIGEAFYALERVGRWGATGLRRGAATSDVVSPLATGTFARHAFSHSAGERVTEMVHHRLLGQLDPVLRDAPFESEWAPQRPRLAEALVLRKAARAALGRVGGRLRRGPSKSASEEADDPFATLWRGQLELHRSVVERAAPDHQLFELVDREMLLRRLESVETVDRGVQRALTLLWALERAPRRPATS